MPALQDLTTFMFDADSPLAPSVVTFGNAQPGQEIVWAFRRAPTTADSALSASWSRSRDRCGDDRDPHDLWGAGLRPHRDADPCPRCAPPGPTLTT